jgi:hypothetical protein
MTDTSALEPAEYLRRLFDDVEFSYLVVVAAQLGIADLLAPGPRSITDLSAATGADAQSLERVLRALASRGLFREDDKRFSLTVLGNPLRQDAPHASGLRPRVLTALIATGVSSRPLARFLRGRSWWPPDIPGSHICRDGLAHSMDPWFIRWSTAIRGRIATRTC